MFYTVGMHTTAGTVHNIAKEEKVNLCLLWLANRLQLWDENNYVQNYHQSVVNTIGLPSQLCSQTNPGAQLMRYWRLFPLYLRNMNVVLAASLVTQQCTKPEWLLILAAHPHRDPYPISDGSVVRVVICMLSINEPFHLSLIYHFSFQRKDPPPCSHYLHALSRRWVGWWRPFCFCFFCAVLCLAGASAGCFSHLSESHEIDFFMLSLCTEGCQKAGCLFHPPFLRAHGIPKRKADKDIWQGSAYLSVAQNNIDSRLHKVNLKQHLIQFRWTLELTQNFNTVLITGLLPTSSIHLNQIWWTVIKHLAVSLCCNNLLFGFADVL